MSARKPPSTIRRRILVVDDNEEIHNDFRGILRTKEDSADFDDMAEMLLGIKSGPTDGVDFELSFAFQGAEALEKVREADAAGAPFMLMFVDVRMPPGWDGIETLSRVWQENSSIQSIICSAYLDYSWRDVFDHFPKTDRLLILKKPFDPIEVRQMAYALTEKWIQRAALDQATSRLELQVRTTQCLVATATFEEGMKDLLRAVCDAYRLPFGAVWLADEGPARRAAAPDRGALRSAAGLSCACVFSAASPDLDAIASASRGAALDPGVGWPGRAAMTDQASVFEDVEALVGDPRVDSAMRAGIRRVFELPIRWNDAGVGVVELMSREEAGDDDSLLAVMAELNPKIGQFVCAKWADEALRASEARHRALLDAIPDTLLRIDKDGLCLDFKGGGELAPVQASDVLGRPIAGLFPSAVAARIAEHIEASRATRAVQVFEYASAEGADGARREYETRIVVGGDNDAFVLIRDITQRNQAERALSEQRRREDLIALQVKALSELTMPLIPIRQGLVVMPLVGAMDVDRARKIQEKLVRGVAERRATVAIVDVTGVPSLERDVAGEILQMARAVRLLGAELVLTGIHPAVARSLTFQGADMQGVVTLQSLEDGMDYAGRR